MEIIRHNNKWYMKSNTGYREILATTDKSLSETTVNIGDNKRNPNYIKASKNIPSPSPEFIQKYVDEYNKGNQIKEVMVEYEPIGRMLSGGVEIPISELLKVDKNNCITITRIKDSWSREEVVNLLHKAYFEGYNQTKGKQFDDWIKNNL